MAASLHSRLPARNASCLILFFLAGLIPALQAEEKVLFIGNSFTIGSGPSVPDIFDALARAGGQPDPVTVMRADGGKDFQYHSGYSVTQAAITSEQWTYVVLQNYSTEPTHIGSVADHLYYGDLLFQQIMANNGSTNVVLYETWSRSAKHSMISGASTGSTFATTAEMQGELRSNYQLLADTLNSNYSASPEVVVAPCGTAWENAGALLPESDPEFSDLHGGDEYHANDNGYYLNACVFYATIYGESPVGLHLDPVIASLGGLSLTEDAAYLEQVAWDTYLESQSNLPLQFVSEPESATVSEFSPAQFSATVTGGSKPYSISWYADGTLIPEAGSLTYSIAAPSRDLDGTVYTVSVTDGNATITSAGATLTVEADGVAPSISSASAAAGQLSLEIEFSEIMDPDSASNPDNYQVISDGTIIPVSSVELGTGGTIVTLLLSAPTYRDFTVEISSNITDLSGNPLAGGTSIGGTLGGAANLTVYLDFGSAAGSTTADGDGNSWNTVSTVATTNSEIQSGLIDSDGADSGYSIQMVRRFNGTNTSGTTESGLYPATATNDSLFGNTATFSGLADVYPAFKLVNLHPQAEYALTFYASRLGTSDNRETLYKVTGSTVHTTTLNPANNVTATTRLENLRPDALNEILIEISPGPDNNNSNSFTYLGVLVLEATLPGIEPVEFDTVTMEGGYLHLEWSGDAFLDHAASPAGPWTVVTPVPEEAYGALIGTAGPSFFRLRTY